MKPMPLPEPGKLAGLDFDWKNENWPGVYISISFPIIIGEEFWNFTHFSEKFWLLISVARRFFLKNMNIEPKNTKNLWKNAQKHGKTWVFSQNF